MKIGRWKSQGLNKKFGSQEVICKAKRLDMNKPDGDQAQENMEANQQDQEEVEAQMEDAHEGQSPPQRLTRSMFKALGARGHLFSLFVISLVEGT